MQYLFERLASPKFSSGDQSEAFNVKTAVAAQIQRIVSARMIESGGELNLLEFGMPNVVELAMSSKNQLNQYGARLGRLIGRYEPRLLNPVVQVESTRDPLMPYQILVTGSLASSTEVELFYFNLPLH
ncbi:type VI secretion system baseplate subunit TssE [Undibacterium sp. Xuan67W]|uniref:type VI secretion system baseplate subunit TssE n=1 Tax=Undibacterium sp. Xuan67W TaxID=3413057 RepID=UPI003BF014CB